MSKDKYQVIKTYVERGWSVIPLRPGDKRPLEDWKPYQTKRATLDEIRAWYEKNPDMNFGVVTGKISGISVIDIDGVTGRESAKKVILPPTLVHKTPKGTHYVYEYDKEYEQGVARLPGIDIRNDGGYIVVAPSQVNGKDYAVILDEDISPAPKYSTVFTAKAKAPKAETKGWVEKAMKGIGKGERNHTAARLAGHYRTKNISESEALEYLKTFADNCTPAIAHTEVEAVVKSIYRYAGDIKNARITEEPDFAQVGFDLKYKWPQYGIEVTLTNLSSSGGRDRGIWCEAEITMDYPGVRKVHYGPKSMNLLTSSSRDANALGKIVDIEWESVLNIIATHATKFYREGSEIENVLDIDVDYEYDPWLLRPLVIEDGLTILFGDGGLGKSTIALAAMLSIQSGKKLLGEAPKKKLKGLYLDWEDSPRTLALRSKKMLNGDAKMIDGVHRLGCFAPLADLADTLRRKIAKEGIGFIVVDSVAAACGGDASSQEVVSKFFNAVNSFKVPVLGIAHQTKTFTDSHKPFGSVYWVNSARATVELVGSQEMESDLTHIILTNRKNNHGQLHSPVGVKVKHSNREIQIDRETPQYGSIQQNGEPSTKEMIYSVLKGRDATVKELVEELGKSKSAIRSVLHRCNSFSPTSGDEGGGRGRISTWGLTNKPFATSDSDKLVQNRSPQEMDF